MARLKFLFFALPLLALWILQPSWLAPDLARAAREETSARAEAIASGAAAKLSASQQRLQAFALQQATSPTLWAALQKAKGAPDVSDERWTSVREAVQASAPSELRGLWIGLSAPSGAPLLGSISGKPSAPPAGVTLPAGDGKPVVVTVGGNRLWMVGFVQSGIEVVLGVPLADDGFWEAEATARHAEAIVLLDKGQVVAAGGPNKDPAGLALKAKTPGKSEVVHEGVLDTFGPIALPFRLGSEGGADGKAPVFIASRQPVPGTSLELVAISSTKPLLVPLASSQGTGLIWLIALIGWTAGWVVVENLRRDQGEAKIDFGAMHQVPVSLEAEPTAPMPVEPRSSPSLPAQVTSFNTPPPGASASPMDDFRQGEAPLPDSPPPVPDLPFPSPNDRIDAPPESAPRGEPTSFGATHLPPEEDTATTRAYSTAGLLAEMAAQNAPEASPETTRVAAIPKELLAQARAAAPSSPPPDEHAATRVNGLMANALQGDDAHFQDVYREFVSTREQCGEPPEQALTFDKFLGKLRKNRDQLVQKYNCRTVRFQVYVKDGKAALKAVPIKD